MIRKGMMLIGVQQIKAVQILLALDEFIVFLKL
jgi:hypothetical protein